MKPPIKLFDLLKPPFIRDPCVSYIWDQNQFMVGMVRGWGEFQYYENGAEIQDELHQFIVDAINEKWERENGSKNKSCPFCGNANPEEFSGITENRLEGTPAEHTSSRFSCSCGAMGPDADTPEEAISAWNRRKG